MGVGSTVGMDEARAQPLSFDAYVQARWTRLVRTAVLLGVDAHTAEDVAQTTLARCFLKWERVAAVRDTDAYVHRVLINTVNERGRRRSTSERPTANFPDSIIADDTELVARNRAILDALGRLPEGQREAVVLRFYADFTEAQAAAALGVAVGTIKSRCARALAALAGDPDLQEMEDR